MSNIVFEKWIPVSDLPNELYLKELHQDSEGFRLFFKGKNSNEKILQIVFDMPLVYRNLDEGDYLQTIGPGVNGWSLFVVHNSEYLAWFNNESQGIHEKQNVIHYAIYTPNDCIDILSAYPPEVKWLNTHNKV